MVKDETFEVDGNEEDDFDAEADFEEEENNEEQRLQQVARLNEAVDAISRETKILNETTKVWLNNVTSTDYNLDVLNNLGETFENAFHGNLKALQDAFLVDPIVLTNLTSTGETLLHYAAMGNQVEVAKWLIEKEVPVNAAESQYNSTAFSYAVQKGHMEMVKLLVNRDAKINFR